MKITFDEKSHIYHIDGHRVPSVTQVLKTLESFDGYPQEAAIRGTYVHTIIELYEAGRLDPSSVDPALAPYLEAWKRFKSENPLQLDFSGLVHEVIVGSKLGYAGRVDMLSMEWIIDIKTGQPTKTHPHQLEAYNAAAIEHTGGKRRKQACLYLAPDESYHVKIYNKEKAAAAVVWNQFIAALTVTNFRNGGKHNE